MPPDPKTRSDAWGSALGEDDAWRLYDRARLMRWQEAAELAESEFGLPRPARSPWYRWLARMRRSDAARRVERAAASVAEAAAMADASGADETLARA